MAGSNSGEGLRKRIHNVSSPPPSPKVEQPPNNFPAPIVPFKEQTAYQRWQYQTFLFLDEPSSSQGAKITSITILCTIVMSIVVFTLQTMPELGDVNIDLWWGLDCFATVVFTVEYMMRLWACVAVADPQKEAQPRRPWYRSSKRLNFVFMVLNVFDFLAILPFYLEEALKGAATTVAADQGAPSSSIAFLKVLRAMRLIRLFRVFKLGKYSQGMKLMMQALVNSAQALWVLFFFIVLGVILFSSAVYYMERLSCKIWPTEDRLTDDIREQMAAYERNCSLSTSGFTDDDWLCCDLKTGAPQNFPSIVAAFWWSIVTMTTVGYGDMVPRTPQGMLVGALCMLLGILLIALPVAIVGSKFQEVYQAMETETQDQQLDLIDCSRDPEGYTGSIDDNLSELVKEFDMDKVHPMLQRQVTSLISLVDNASLIQRRLKHLHQKEESMHEQLHGEFEDFIHMVKENSDKRLKADDKDRTVKIVTGFANLTNSPSNANSKP